MKQSTHTLFCHTLFWMIFALFGLSPGLVRANELADVFVPSGLRFRNQVNGKIEVKNAAAENKRIDLGERQLLDFQLLDAEKKQELRTLQNELIQAIQDLIEPYRYGFESYLGALHPGKEDTFEKFRTRLKRVEDLVLKGAGNDRIYALVSQLREQFSRAGKDVVEHSEIVPWEGHIDFGPKYTRNLAVMTALYYEAVAHKFETGALSAASLASFQSVQSVVLKKSGDFTGRERREVAREAAEDVKRFTQDCRDQANRAYRAQLRANEYAEWSQSRFVESPPVGLSETKDAVCPSVVFVGPAAGEANVVRIYDEETVRNAIDENAGDWVK